MTNEVKVTNIKSLIITITLLVLIVTAGTFAWLSYRSKDTKMVLTIGDINNIQITLKPYELDLELSPVLSYTSLDTNNEYVTVTVTNNSGTDQYYSLYYDISEIDSSLQSTSFKYTILKSTDNGTTYPEDVTGNFSNANTTDNFYILEEISIPANTTYTYKVYTWVDGNDGPNIENAAFKADLQAELYGNTRPLPSFIRKNAVIDNINSTHVSNATPGIKWDEIASDTNGKGIYIRSGTENNENPIYYYRGAVDNNVYFGGFCWKIVRTTETGGLKMIYNGTPTSGSCGSGTTSQSGASATIGSSKYNASYNDAKYVGYTYVNSGVETDSTIKGVIDTWYQTNLLTNYDSYLEDAVFCNDKSTHAFSEFTSAEQSAFYLQSTYTIYSPTYRLVKKTGPSVTCPNSSDAYTKSSTIGNGKLTYPVGLLTIDEIWMAGEGAYNYGTSGTGYKNTTYYLQSNKSWWSLSPGHWSGSYSNVWYANSSFGLDRSGSSSYGVRPVVSLKPGLTYKGSGTSDDPYVIIE